jgi:hypothetical protein
MARNTHHLAGKRQSLIALEVRDPVDDGYGNQVSGEFAEKFQQYAEITYLKGGENVMASRLESHQPAVISVLADEPQMTTVTPDWRVREIDTGILFNVRTITRTPNRAYFEMLCETGVNPG